MKFTVSLALAAAISGAKAQAFSPDLQVWTSTPRLYSACKTVAAERPRSAQLSAREIQLSMACANFVSSVYGAISADTTFRETAAKAKGLSTPGLSLVCLPKDSPKGTELIRSVVSEMESESDLMTIPPADAVFLAIMRKYPC